MKSVIILLAISMFVAGVDAVGQTEDDTPIKVRTLLANVPIIVSDRGGKHIPGLKVEDFKVTSAGQPTEIVYFSDAEMPLNVAIVLDITGSVSGVIADIKKAANAFVDRLGPEDQAMLVTFGDKVVVKQPLTPVKNKIKKEISSLKNIPGGIGLMNEALLQVLVKELAVVKGRKAIILLTDAGEINKFTTPRMLDEVIEGDTVIYPIFYPTVNPWFPRSKSVTLDEYIKKSPVGTLNNLAVHTGGRLLVAQGNDFGTQFQTITDELKKMYVIGFYPEQPTDGSPGQIKIETIRTDLVLRTRRTIRPKAAPK